MCCWLGPLGRSCLAFYMGLWAEGQGPASVNPHTTLPAPTPDYLDPLSRVQWGLALGGICFTGCDFFPIKAHLTVTFLGILKISGILRLPFLTFE